MPSVSATRNSRSPACGPGFSHLPRGSVLVIDGPPMADDLALSARGIKQPASHPALGAGMRKVISAHAKWAGPAVIEGWQFDPQRITKGAWRMSVPFGSARTL